MIIWLPERMNIQAANTLLKILEEPPDGTHFFLVSEHPELLLPTIRSRCQMIRVNPTDQASNGLVLQRTEQQEEVMQSAQQLITFCFEKKLLPAIECIEEVAGFGRERQRQWVLYMLELVRIRYREHLLNHSSLPNSFFSEAIGALNDALMDIDRNVNAKMTFYTVVLRIFFSC
jgi:DNA polymerase-3 subunit delta'